MPISLLSIRSFVLWMLQPMIVTEFTKEGLAYRRFCRQAIDDGFERVSENGAPLWKFHRGGWTDRRIVDVRIAPGGKELWIKHEAEKASPYWRPSADADGGLRKIMPDDPLPGVWAGVKRP